MKTIYALVTLLCVSHVIPVSASERADTVYTNGKIYTVNEAQPWAESVAIKDGMFIAVGSATEMQAVTGDATEIVDLDGRFVMPGLVDTHTHPFLSAIQTLDQLELDNPQTPEDIQQQVVAYAEANPDKEWILGLAWPKGMFPGGEPAPFHVGRSGRRHSNLPDGPGWTRKLVQYQGA